MNNDSPPATTHGPKFLSADESVPYLEASGQQLLQRLLNNPMPDHPLHPVCVDLLAHLADLLEDLWLARPATLSRLSIIGGDFLYLSLVETGRTVIIDLVDLLLELLSTSGPRPELTYAEGLRHLAVQTQALLAAQAEPTQRTQERRAIALSLALLQEHALRIVERWRPQLAIWLNNPQVDTLPLKRCGGSQ